jgi:type VI protein secretion system component VasK
MGIVWMVLELEFVLLSVALAYGSIVAELLNVPPIGLSWEWANLIGLTALLISLGIIIVRLHRENSRFRSEEYKRRKEKEELELKELRYERSRRGALFE